TLMLFSHSNSGPQYSHSFPTRRSSDLDRVEDAQAGVGRVARQQDHLHLRRILRQALVEREQLAHHREGHARLEDLVLQLALVLRSEEHTSELQSRENLVCRLLLEKKK